MQWLICLTILISPLSLVWAETDEKSVSSVICNDTLVVQDLIKKSASVRSVEQLDNEARALTQKLITLAKDPSTKHIPLKIESTLEPEYEPFRIASGFFLLTGDDKSTKDLANDLTLLEEHSNKLKTNIAAMNVILNPSSVSWWKRWKYRKSNKEGTTDNIQVCRDNMEVCLKTSYENLLKRESDLINLDNVLNRAKEEEIILTSVAREVQQNIELTEGAKNSINGVLELQIKAFQHIVIILTATKQNLSNEIDAGRAVVRSAKHLTQVEIQRLAVTGAPARILKPASLGARSAANGDGVREEFKQILSVKNKTSVLTLMIKALEKADSISDAELLHILTNIPKKINLGEKGSGSLKEVHDGIRKMGGSSWKNEDTDWLSTDVRIALVALKKTKQRVLPNESLSQLADMVEKIIKSSNTIETNWAESYTDQIYTYFNKLALDVLLLEQSKPEQKDE